MTHLASLHRVILGPEDIGTDADLYTESTPVEWLPGHGDVETAATTWRPSLRVRIVDALRPSLRRF